MLFCQNCHQVCYVYTDWVVRSIDVNLNHIDNAIRRFLLLIKRGKLKSDPYKASLMPLRQACLAPLNWHITPHTAKRGAKKKIVNGSFFSPEMKCSWLLSLKIQFHVIIWFFYYYSVNLTGLFKFYNNALVDILNARLFCLCKMNNIRCHTVLSCDLISHAFRHVYI